MKFQIVAALLIAGLSVAPTVLAQQPEGQRERPGNASATRPAEERPRMRANVQIELTVTDSTGPAGPQKKSVRMLVAEGMMGRIRSTRQNTSAVLNVDATPFITENMIRLQMTLEYSPLPAPGAAPAVAHVNEMVTVMLTPGKPTTVSQAADPSADRQVTVEVTATILK
jgi:hypothetical protein